MVGSPASDAVTVKAAISAKPRRAKLPAGRHDKPVQCGSHDRGLRCDCDAPDCLAGGLGEDAQAALRQNGQIRIGTDG